MAIYQPEMTLREARALYFALNNFGDDGGYDDEWVKIWLGPVPIFFPNISSRRSAVRFHDLHHILTEYPTTLAGEAEIAAWEIATGDLPNLAGWFLDLGGFAYGLALYPRKLYRAFMRGRRSLSLYKAPFSEELLSRTVGDVRKALYLDRETGRAKLSDQAAFIKWAIISVLSSMTAGVLVWTPLTAMGMLSLVIGDRWSGRKIRASAKHEGMA